MMQYSNVQNVKAVSGLHVTMNLHDAVGVVEEGVSSVVGSAGVSCWKREAAARAARRVEEGAHSRWSERIFPLLRWMCTLQLLRDAKMSIEPAVMSGKPFRFQTSRSVLSFTASSP